MITTSMIHNVYCYQTPFSTVEFKPSRFVDITFFFQAEDGIRDVAVTGVQTCALPILVGLKRQGSSPLPASESGAQRVLVYYNATLKLREGYDFKDWEEIGRASCRERA